MPNPFGLAAGSTPPTGQATYHVEFTAVPNPHPLFHAYRGIWEPEFGLCKIFAESEKFENDEFGVAAKEIYGRVRNQLTRIYGQPEVIECVDEEGAFLKDDDFIASLSYGERTHMSRWDTSTGSLLDAGIQKIHLFIIADDSAQLKVTLVYTFKESSSTENDLTGVDAL